MNKSNNEGIKKVLDTQQQQQQESASENEESDSITDQSSSTTSDNGSQQHNDGRKKSKNAKATTMPVTQFSVQRSDTDCLRMKISAIRPTGTTCNASSVAPTKDSKKKQSQPQSQLGDKVNNNVIVEILKVKLSNKTTQIRNEQKQQQQLCEGKTTAVATTSNMSVDTLLPSIPYCSKTGGGNEIGADENTIASTAAALTMMLSDSKSDASSNLTTSTTAATANSTCGEAAVDSGSAAAADDAVTAGGDSTRELPITPTPKVSYLSDATESGCSEATTTTIAAGIGKSSKKVKVKRKKAQSKSAAGTSDTKKSLKKLQQQQKMAAFSSDSEDEPLKKHQQRAPRLLLTAINSKSSVPHSKTLTSLVSASAVTTNMHGSDNIDLSSSDNELPDLVSAAIKRVESDIDDTGEGFRKTRTKLLPQYQSTLLQDFMEKTQMLGQTTTRTACPTRPSPERSVKALRAELLTNLNSNSQTESIASSSNSNTKKRRGRPKRVATTKAASATATTSDVVAAAVAPSININESGDSGVISTTSTTQSTSPSPKLLLNSPQPQQQKQRRKDIDSATIIVAPSANSPIKSANDASNAIKPKIDIAYLDKRMYATERVLYPPPRNKRKQLTQATTAASTIGSAQKSTSSSAAAAAAAAIKITKEELQLDPIWRKIDVNKKFRRPSVTSVGYKSDGGAGCSGSGNNTTICSKILAAKSGYVSDYGSFHPRSSHHHHQSGYKSDASCKSRFSTKSCGSRRSRAKSCGYRSDCKETGAMLKSTKFRRKRRCSLMKAHSKSVGNLNDDQDILQLAGLSLGQSSEESNEYVCKPSLENLPRTSVSKKYGEINRFIATGEYFGRGSGIIGGGGVSGSALHSSYTGNMHAKRIYDTANEDGSQDGFSSRFTSKLKLQRKSSLASELTHDILPNVRKIKSRRSSVASFCSSYYSSTSKVKRRHRRKSFRFPSSSKCSTIDSKLLTEIDILTSTFNTLCLIQSGSTAAGGASGSGTTKREGRDKRAMKKRKISENLDIAGALTPSGGSTKRRHKKANSSSPDDHKLPLKKRHYLLTPGDKSTEAAVAVAAKLFANNTEAWAAAAAAAKSSVSTKAAQQHFGIKSAKAVLTPKKRHLMQDTTHHSDDVTTSSGISAATATIKASNSSPLRIVVDSASLSGGKLLDISPISLSNLKQSNEVVYKKRSRLEGLVSKIANHSDEQHAKETSKMVSTTATMSTATSNTSTTTATSSITTNNKSMTSQLGDSETSCPPPGVFEPSVELEIQIPPIAKLSDTATAIITKSEVDSPLLMDLNKSFPAAATKVEGVRVVEALLDKTGGNLILKRKRKKINRTGFPTVRRKKRKITENLLLDITPDMSEDGQKMVVHKTKATQSVITPTATAAITTTDTSGTTLITTTTTTATTSHTATNSPATSAVGLKICDRVPQVGETSATFLERANRTPRLSVVSLERLQSTPTPSSSKQERAAATTATPVSIVTPTTPTTTKTTTVTRQLAKRQKRDIIVDEKLETVPAPAVATTIKKPKLLRTETAEAEKLIASNLRGSRNRKVKSNADENINAASDAVPKQMAEKNQPQQQPQQQQTTTKMTTQISRTDTPAFTKSSMHKIITAKSLQSKVKLPAGIDPNTNFSCKIRLKRRTAMHPPVVVRKSPVASQVVVAPEIPPTAEEVTAEAAAKDAQIEQPEHDVLPSADAVHIDELEAASDTSDEKSSSTTSTTMTAAVRKISRVRKTYLPAGLFSDYFKMAHICNEKTSATLSGVKKTDKKDAEKAFASSVLAAASSHTPAAASTDVNTSSTLLPPPPYCEKFFRRTQNDFLLPYDIWWAYTNFKLPTRITVPSWNYRKIRTNVYAESVRPNTAGMDHPTCNCKSDVGCGENCLNRMVYTECSPTNCPSRDKCHNQKIQRHEVAPGVERFMTENKGWGVRTKLPIQKGTYILEYVGEVVTEREFKDRMGTIYLNDIHHYCLHLDGGLVIDGHRMGSDGRFVNHSCQPNCEMQKWSVNGLSRMALFAKRNIEDGEELTYDYNFSLFNPSEGQPCRCNTPQCRGVIGGKSQRIKPLPVEAKPSELSPKDGRLGRPRKRKARKNIDRLLSKDVVVARTRTQHLSEKEKKLVKQYGIFLVRNFERIRICKMKRKTAASAIAASTNTCKATTPAHSPASPVHINSNTNSSSSSSSSNNIPNNNSSNNSTPATISNRRPSTPSPLAVQISALCSSRNMKTRGLTLAVQDPEVEKMAKVALILRDICTSLETIKVPNDDKITLISVALTTNPSTGGNKKKKAVKSANQKQVAIDLKTVQSNIEQGYYKQPVEFDNDMQKIFAEAKHTHSEDKVKLKALQTLIAAYEAKKCECYEQLRELVADETVLNSFRGVGSKSEDGEKSMQTSTTAEPTTTTGDAIGETKSTTSSKGSTPTEDIIRCICGLYKDEGLMIQCSRCMVWQHTECTKADVNAENYMCENCEPRTVNREIPLEDFTEDGHRYYLSLMRGELHVRQGDAVYVLRDIPIRDAQGNVVPTKKHTYETIGHIDYNECDIFRVERLWKNDEGKRFIFGHHFLRPHETFHEPSRRFYPNEVVRVPLYEVVPIELVIGRCWVLDRTTFCKGRPVECTDEEHCYICELRVDKTARFFSKAKVNYPICTKSYAFRKFSDKLKISKTYAPHDVDPAMLKTKKQKTDSEIISSASSTISSSTATVTPTPTSTARKRQTAVSPATVHIISPLPLTMQIMKEKRTRLENVLKAMKLKSKKNTQTSTVVVANEAPIDLSYLLSGRGARQRKTLTSSSMVSVPI